METLLIKTSDLTDETREAIVMSQVRNYTSKPCAICGQPFTPDQERHSIYVGNDKAAHEKCWNTTPYTCYNPQPD